MLTLVTLPVPVAVESKSGAVAHAIDAISRFDWAVRVALAPYVHSNLRDALGTLEEVSGEGYFRGYCVGGRGNGGRVMLSNLIFICAGASTYVLCFSWLLTLVLRSRLLVVREIPVARLGVILKDLMTLSIA